MQDIFHDTEKLIFCAIIVMMVGDMMVGLVLFITAKQFVARAVEAVATVVGIEKYATSNGGAHYRLEVAYQDGMGQEYKAKIPAGKETREGERVEILYDPDMPQKAKPNNKMMLFIVPYALMGAVLPFGVMLSMLVVQGVAEVPF